MPINTRTRPRCRTTTATRPQSRPVHTMASLSFSGCLSVVLLCYILDSLVVSAGRISQPVLCLGEPPRVPVVPEPSGGWCVCPLRSGRTPGRLLPASAVHICCYCRVPAPTATVSAGAGAVTATATANATATTTATTTATANDRGGALRYPLSNTPGSPAEVPYTPNVPLSETEMFVWGSSSRV